MDGGTLWIHGQMVFIHVSVHMSYRRTVHSPGPFATRVLSALCVHAYPFRRVNVHTDWQLDAGRLNCPTWRRRGSSAVNFWWIKIITLQTEKFFLKCSSAVCDMNNWVGFQVWRCSKCSSHHTDHLQNAAVGLFFVFLLLLSLCSADQQRKKVERNVTQYAPAESTWRWF